MTNPHLTAHCDDGLDEHDLNGRLGEPMRHDDHARRHKP